MLILTEDEKKYANYLPRTHQHIFEVIEGLPEPTYKAVAELLGRPVGTVKSRLSRARAMVRYLARESAPVVTEQV